VAPVRSPKKDQDIRDYQSRFFKRGEMPVPVDLG